MVVVVVGRGVLEGFLVLVVVVERMGRPLRRGVCVCVFWGFGGDGVGFYVDFFVWWWLVVEEVVVGGGGKGV